MGEERETYAKIFFGEGVTSGKPIVLLERDSRIYGFTKCDNGKYSCLGRVDIGKIGEDRHFMPVFQGGREAQIVADLIEASEKRGTGPSLNVSAHLCALLGEE